MPITKEKLPLDANAKIIVKLAEDFSTYVSANAKFIPNNKSYVIRYNPEPNTIERSARVAALNSIASPKPIIKQAFDTRRIDQETQRNPRQNLQYWNRSDQFIDEDTQNKINVYSKLMEVLDNIKKSYGTQPEYHESYARVLHENVERALRLKIGDQDIFAPQLAYLDQLIFARYRLTPDDIVKNSSFDLRDKILAKDENLIRRGAYLNSTNIEKNSLDKNALSTNGNMQVPYVIANQNPVVIQDALGKLFEQPMQRKAGEKIVERTITITIRDEVKD